MEERHWEDATGTKSYFEGLTFQANRKWTSGIITFVGTRKKQKISFKVTAGSRTILEDDFNLEEGEVKRYNFYVNGNVGVNVSGYVERAALFHGAGARVDVAL